jgi:hypothetical protein
MQQDRAKAEKVSNDIFVLEATTAAHDAKYCVDHSHYRKQVETRVTCGVTHMVDHRHELENGRNLERNNIFKVLIIIVVDNILCLFEPKVFWITVT